MLQPWEARQRGRDLLHPLAPQAVSAAAARRSVSLICAEPKPRRPRPLIGAQRNRGTAGTRPQPRRCAALLCEQLARPCDWACVGTGLGVEVLGGVEGVDSKGGDGGGLWWSGMGHQSFRTGEVR